MTENAKNADTQAAVDNDQKASKQKGKVGKDQQDADTQAAVEAPAKFKLLKNSGYSPDGKTSEFFEAGTEFDAAKDGHIITKLTQLGARFEEVK